MHQTWSEREREREERERERERGNGEQSSRGVGRVGTMAAVNSRDKNRLEKRSSRRAWCTFGRHFLSSASAHCTVAHVRLRWRRCRRLVAVGENFLFSSLAWQLRPAKRCISLAILTSAAPQSICRLGKHWPVFSRPRVINRPYFLRPRKYRRLFSEPTCWPRRSRGQYGEGNNQAGVSKAEGNKSLIPGRLARSPLTCPSPQKVRDEYLVRLRSKRCNASTGSPWLPGPNCFDRLFSTCNRQLADTDHEIAQVDRPKILEQMVFGSSPLFSGVFVSFYLFKLRT